VHYIINEYQARCSERVFIKVKCMYMIGVSYNSMKNVLKKFTGV